MLYRAALTVLALAAAAPVLVLGVDPAVDGTAGEWTVARRVSPPYYEKAVPTEAELYMTFAAGNYSFYVKPQAGNTLINAHVYMNLDADRSTGYTGAAQYQMPSGADAYALVQMDFSAVPLALSVGLYSGCSNGQAGCSTKLLDLPFRNVSGDEGVEFTVSQAALRTATGMPALADMEVALLVANSGWIFQERPRYFLDYFSFYADLETLPACAAAGSRQGAVVFSDDVQARFFQDKAYAQLFMSVQYQFMQAGVPYDRLTEADLLDTSKSCQYKVIVVPYMAWTTRDKLFGIRKALFKLLHGKYGVGVVTIGDFLTNEAAGTGAPLPGDPYYQIKSLFGIEDDYPVFAQTSATVITVANVTESVFKDKTLGQVLMDESVAGTFTNMYVPAENTAFHVTTLARQTITTLSTGVVSERNCILASELLDNPFGVTSGRVVHFSTLEVAANRDLIWRAIEWVMLRDGAVFGLQMTRNFGLFVSRNDMDQSMFNDQATILEPALLTDLIEPWYEQFGYVCTYYINVGNNRGDEEFTDWSWAVPLYNQYIALENEIGSHSFTHPHDMNLLTAAQLKFEFDQAQHYIMGNMSLARLGTAQPGATETLATAYKVQPFFNTSYFSGGYSGVSAGYPGAYGFLDPNSTMVYMAPNMYFDFTLIGWLKWTTAVSQQFLLNQAQEHAENSKMPILNLPWHDYLNFWNDNTYTFTSTVWDPSLIEPTIAQAHADGYEFATGMDFSDRIRAFTSSHVTTTALGGGDFEVTVAAPSGGGSLGVMSLSVSDATSASPQVVAGVSNWFAYSESRVFLPHAGGTFTVSLAAAQPAVMPTHITALPMRMRLDSCTGNGSLLAFGVTGRGNVTVSVPAALAASVVVDGGDAAYLDASNTLTVVFSALGAHACEIGTIADVPGGVAPAAV